MHLGNLDRARELFAASRERVFRCGYRSFVPYLGVAAAALASAEGDYSQVARMVRFSDHAFAAIGQVPDPDDAGELSAARGSALAALGASAFDAQYATGAAWPPDHAFGLTWQR
ncbi:hypothetical protein GCM10009850_115060 [Nonomuraea monospora]|uniref:Uncharacterized protein n=1 Tax=Nonomuraea monospora TaxID=568818 RepID=A0ABN3D376_9ACTN